MFSSSSNQLDEQEKVLMAMLTFLAVSGCTHLLIPISSMGNPLALDLGRPTRARNQKPEAPATSRNVYRPPGT